MIEAAVELDDDAMEAYLEGNEPTEETLKRLIRKAVRTIAFFRCCAARPSRTRACSRCSTPSSTICRRRSTFRGDQGHRPKTEAETVGKSDDRAVLGARLQDHGRPVRRHAHLLPHLFGQARIKGDRC
jgi:elongation factor G